jgi:hypothetical protein
LPRLEQRILGEDGDVAHAVARSLPVAPSRRRSAAILRINPADAVGIAVSGPSISVRFGRVMQAPQRR